MRVHVSVFAGTLLKGQPSAITLIANPTVYTYYTDSPKTGTVVTYAGSKKGSQLTLSQFGQEPNT